MQTPDIDHQQKEPSIVRGTLRFWGFIIAVDIIALMLGIAFALMAHGLAMGTLRLANHWQPARRFTERICGFGLSPLTSKINSKPMNAIHLLTTIALIMLFVGVGLLLLVHNGFYEQNIFWLATH